VALVFYSSVTIYVRKWHLLQQFSRRRVLKYDRGHIAAVRVTRISTWEEAMGKQRELNALNAHV